MFSCCSVCQSTSKEQTTAASPQRAPAADTHACSEMAGASASTTMPGVVSSLGSSAFSASSSSQLAPAQGVDPAAEQVVPYRRAKSVTRGRTKLNLDEDENSPAYKVRAAATAFSSYASDGGTGGSVTTGDDGIQAVMKSNPCSLMRSFTKKLGSESNRSPDSPPGQSSPPPNVHPVRGKLRRRDSQLKFASVDQVIIVFDWDDTLFPTSYIQDDLQLRWNYPISQQKHIPAGELRMIEEKLDECQKHVDQVLRIACARGHTVILTLAKTGWVDLSCRNFYPMIGKLLTELNIPIVYAQERSTKEQMTYNKAAFESDEDQERFWGLVKGRAIADEVYKFYQQYPGQTWKNIISIGDSCFERYGLLAATSAYMRGEELGEDNAAPMSTAEGESWQTVDDGHVKKVRAKAVKLVDRPEIEELIIELEMISKWMDQMVELDSGFDLDLDILEDESQVGVIDAVLRGALPASALPKPNYE